MLFSVLSLSACTSAEPSVQVGFSPEGSAQTLVLGTINEAKQSIRMMAYSFTSPEIVKALRNARQRGVDVKIVVDEKASQGKPNRSALNLLANAKISIRTVNEYSILHDKVIIVDEKTVQTGSFNYSRAAHKRNSENVIVIKDMPDVAKSYLKHWQSRWDSRSDWKLAY